MISTDNIKIYIINLKKRTDRKEHMTDLLNKIGFKNYQFVIPLNVTNQTLKLLPNNLNINLISKNALSLLLTHIYIINNTTEKFFFIMEDDIINNIPTNKILSKIEYIIRTVPKDTDMIRLEMCSERCSKMTKYKDDIFKLYQPNCTACLFFLEKSQKKIKKYFNDVNCYQFTLINKIKNGWGIDNFYQNLNKTKKLISYGYYPTIFKQSINFGSNIQGSPRSFSIFARYGDLVCIEEIYSKIFLIIVILLTCLILYKIYTNKSINS